MKVLLLASLLALAMGLPTSSKPEFYHEAVGIQTAAQIKAEEEAMDFTGMRISGGLAAALGTHPYLAGLVITLTSGQTSVCAGALLSHTQVVTAAQCYFDGSSLAQVIQVVLGSSFLYSGGLRITSNTVVMHPAWNTSSRQNNIAIITIPNVEYTATISNIDLPTGGLLSNSFAGVWTQAVGYGRTSASSSQSKIQMWLEVISEEACEKAHPTRASPTTLCTDGSRNQSPCNDNLGGPLIGISDGRQVLLGIGSFVSTSSCLNAPAVYSRITSYGFWLASQLA